MIKTLQVTLDPDPLYTGQEVAIAGMQIFIPQTTDLYGRVWGVYTPAATPPNTISVNPGDTVRFNVQFYYLGPAASYSLYCSMGDQTAGIFNEDPSLTKSFSKSVPLCNTQTTITTYGDILIPTSYKNFGWRDAYCKIVSPQLVSPIYIDCINIVAFSPTFTSITITNFAKV